MNPDKQAYVITAGGLHMVEFARPEYIARHTDAGVFFVYQDRGYDKLVDEYEYRKRELITHRKDPNFVRSARVYIKFLELEIKQYEDIIRAGQDEGDKFETTGDTVGEAVTEEEFDKFERADTHYTLEEFTLGEGIAAPAASETSGQTSSKDILDAMMETGKFEPQ